MKAKKIWMVQHPTDKSDYRVSVEDHSGEIYYFDNWTEGEPTAVEWKEYVLIEVE